MRQRLAAMRLDSFVKTTGGKGLHVVVPAAPESRLGRGEGLCEAVAEAMERDAPGRFLTRRRRARATARSSSTICATAAARQRSPPTRLAPAPDAPVSTPLGWDELSPGLTSNHFTVANLPARLAHLTSDPWAELFKLKQTLPK